MNQQHNNIILALDGATEQCSLALFTPNVTIAKIAPSLSNHSEHFLPLIDEILTGQGLTIADVDYIAYARGPGSFTGVRLSCALAQGLAFGLNIPVIGISNLALLAQECFERFKYRNIIAMIDARMGEIYCAQFMVENDRLQLVLDEQVCSPQKALSQLQLQKDQTYALVGTGFDAYEFFAQHLHQHKNVVKTDVLLPNARFMKALIDVEQATACDQIEPVYLRNEITWKKLPNKQ